MNNTILASATKTDKKAETTSKVQHAKLYKVLLHNDDTHSFEGVIEAVKKVFFYDYDKCFDIVMTAHKTGTAICRIEPYEPAEHHMGMLQSFTLLASIEPE